MKTRLGWGVGILVLVGLLVFCLRWLGDGAVGVDSRRLEDARETQPSRVESSDLGSVGEDGALLRRSLDPSNPSEGDIVEAPTEIWVEDRWGKALSGVRVLAWTSTEVLELGETDGAGRLEARLGGVIGLEGQLDGYARARRTVGPDPPEVLWLRLQPGRSLEGRVLLRGSGTPVEGVRVLAHLKGYRPEPHSVLRVRDGSPLGISGVSDADGVFRLEGMDIDLDYRLAAGGRGYVLWGQCVVPAGDRMAPQLEVGRLFGVRVIWVDPAGGEPVSSSRLWTDFFSSGVSGRDSEIQFIPESWPSPNLAGGFLEDPAVPYQHSSFESTSLYVCSALAERLGPFRVSKTIPGYARSSTQVWATPIEDEIAIHLVQLEPVTDEFGSLTVEFEGWKGLSSSRTFESPRVMLQIQHSESEKEISTILDLEKRVDAIGAIPTGEVVFSISRSQNRWPVFDDDAPRYQLQEGENRIPIDISEWGGIEMEFTDAHGPILGGPATFVLDLTSGAAADERLRFRGAPYRYFGLDPGTYTLTAEPNEMIGREPMMIEGIEVEAGEMTRVQFPVGP